MKIMRTVYIVFMFAFLGLAVYDGMIEPRLPEHSMGLIDIYELIVYTTSSVAFGWLSTREK